MSPALAFAVILVSVAVGFGVAMLVIAKRRRKLSGPALKKIQAAWLHAKMQQNPTLKIVEADKVLDEALRLLGYAGTLGDKLKKAGPRFSNLNALWSAHKLRNKLVHELQYKPSQGETDKAMDVFFYALTELGLE